MKHLLLIAFLSATFLNIAQTTSFYKNIFGSYGSQDFQNTPLINGMIQLENNEYFVTSSHNPYADYYSCAKLDSNFNPIWTKSFNEQTGQTTEDFVSAAELSDGSIVTVGWSSGNSAFTKFDPMGNMEFSKYYYGTGPNDGYTSRTLCPSSLDDTSYVTMFAECSVQFGLFKFDKNGTIQWGHEYSISGPYTGSVYDLSLALNQGYICRGMRAGATLKRGLILTAKDDGSLNKCKEFEHIDSTIDFVVPAKVYTSHADNSYYVPINYVSNNVYESGHMMQLDSNLNIVNTWNFTHPDPNTTIRIRNIANTNDGHLIINGEFYNPSDYPTYQFFVLRFDPQAATNNILWAKEFKAVSSDQYWHSTFSLKGLFVKQHNNQIIMPMSAHRDGSAVMSLDENATEMCNLNDVAITAPEAPGLSTIDNPLTYINEPTTEAPVSLSMREETHSDTTLCGIDPTVFLELDSKPEIVETLIDFDDYSIRNSTDEPLDVSLYNLQGQQVGIFQLDPFEEKSLQHFPTGMLLFRAIQDKKLQEGKIQIP